MFKKHIVVLLIATSAVALSPVLASSNISKIRNCSPKPIPRAVLHMRESNAILNAIVRSRTKSLRSTNGKYANPSSAQITLLRTLAEDMDSAVERCYLELAQILEADRKKDAEKANDLTGSK